jgi:hypothetical protein
VEGMCLLLSLLWETGHKVSQNKSQIFQNSIKYLSFHLSWGNAGLGPRGNKLSVPCQSPRSASKSESFWELWVSTESGSLTTLSWLSPSTK